MTGQRSILDWAMGGTEGSGGSGEQQTGEQPQKRRNTETEERGGGEERAQRRLNAMDTKRPVGVGVAVGRVNISVAHHGIRLPHLGVVVWGF